MTRNEHQAKVELYRRELRLLENIRITCNTCSQNASGWCNRFAAAPPEDVIKAGCDEWEWDGIPF